MSKAELLNNGEPDENGKYVAVVDLEDGTNPQRFIGDSYREVAEKLLNAQMHATTHIRTQGARIRELEIPDAPPPRTKLQPRPLTADERFTVARDIGDPTRSPEAIKTVVEAELGGSLKDIREQLNSSMETEDAQLAATETRAFLEETPEFYQSDY